MWKAFSVAVCALFAIALANRPCGYRSAGDSGICVCNITYCDTLEPPKLNGGYIECTSSKSGKRFEYKTGKFRQPTVKNGILEPIKPEVTYVRIEGQLIPRREIVGFGGGLTTAESFLLNQLSLALRNQFYRSYFSNLGSEYNIIRVGIGGCSNDFRQWAYNDEPEYMGLTNFTKLEPEDERRVTQIKNLKQISRNPNVRVLASACSPPRWMKTSFDWSGATNYLNPQYYNTWADYFLEYIRLMKKNDVQIYGIFSFQNISISF